MVRLYGPFLVRYWRLGGDERRIEIRHIQSGGRTCVPSLAAAIQRIDAHCRGSAESDGHADRHDQDSKVDEEVQP